jgi:hypothetical protein
MGMSEMPPSAENLGLATVNCLPYPIAALFMRPSSIARVFSLSVKNSPIFLSCLWQIFPHIAFGAIADRSLRRAGRTRPAGRWCQLRRR